MLHAEWVVPPCKLVLFCHQFTLGLRNKLNSKPDCLKFSTYLLYIIFLSSFQGMKVQIIFESIPTIKFCHTRYAPSETILWTFLIALISLLLRFVGHHIWQQDHHFSLNRNIENSTYPSSHLRRISWQYSALHCNMCRAVCSLWKHTQKEINRSANNFSGKGVYRVPAGDVVKLL